MTVPQTGVWELRIQVKDAQHRRWCGDSAHHYLSKYHSSYSPIPMFVAVAIFGIGAV
jgi:hypothetical protein